MNRRTHGHARSQRQLAKMLKVSRATASRLVADGLKPINGHGYPLDQARQLLSVRTLRARSVASDPDALELKRQKLSLDVQKAQAELAITKAEWTEVAKVERAWNTAVVNVRNAMLGLGSQLAPRLIGLGVLEIRALIDQESLKPCDYWPIASTVRTNSWNGS